MGQFIDSNKLPEREVVKGFHGKFIHSDNNTIALWDVENGSELPEHHHVYEQTTYVESGEFEITISEQTYILTAGMSLIIPPNEIHRGRALSECKIIDTFFPKRKDFIIT